MAKVLGIGGFFFRSNDPDKLAAWYAEHLGVDPCPRDYDTPPWHQAAGPTVVNPYPADDGPRWWINFRVRDLDAMVRQLRAAGIEVTPDAEVYPNGRFARLKDPEGNPVELWEPA